MIGTLLSCSTASTNPFPDIETTTYVGSFPQELELKGESVVLDEHSFGTVWLYAFDSVLITCSPSASVFFNGYDINTKKFKGSFGNKGRGVHEYIIPPRLFKGKDKNIHILDLGGKMASTHMDTLLRYGYPKNSQQDSITVAGKGINYPLFVDEQYLIIRRVSFENEKVKDVLQVFDWVKDTVLREMTVFDFTKEERMPDILHLQYSPIVSPDGERLYLGFASFDQINSYSLNGTENYTLSSSKEKKLRSFDETFNTSLVSQKKYYQHLTCSNKYLFALYQNDYGRKLYKEGIAPSIQVFTFEGEPIAQFQVNEFLMYMVVDEDSKRIWGVTKDQEIFTYNIEGVLK